MGKTLVVAEKPSVARDLAAALPGSFTQSKDKTHLSGDDHVITWAVGHLVGLAEPDAYDPKLKKWRFADLPIVPDEFKLVPNDERSAKQLKAIHKLMADAEIERIVNACDAGREGELIFAYLYDLAKVKKPVDRLWLSSMTKKAIGEAFEQLRPGEEMKPLEAAARSRSEADWVVGMNATRAASIRLRAAFDGAVSLGRVQTPTLALVARREEEIRAFKPEPYWLVEARFEASGQRALLGPLHGRQAAAGGGGGHRDRRRRHRPAGRDHEAREEGGARAPAAPLRPDLAPAPREHALRLLGAAHAGGRPAALRGAQGAHLPAHELALPDRRHDRRDQADRRPGRPQRAVPQGVRVRAGARQAAARARGQRQEGPGPPRDHPDALRARPRPHGPGRAEGLRPGRQALPGRLPPRGRLRAHARRDDGDRARLPHQRPAADRAGLEGRLRRGGRPAARRGRLGRRPAAAEARPGRGRTDALRRVDPQGDPAARGASPTRRCWARWRPPARRSRTRSCARR